MEIFQAFGLDVKLLIANLINFLILVFILYKLGYKPVLNFVNERQKKIEKGIKDAEDASKKLSDAAEEREKILSDAHKQAQNIINKAKDQARAQSEGIIKNTKNETKEIIEKAKKEIELEKEQSVDMARKEIASMVVEATEKLLKKKIDKKEDERIIKENVRQANEE